MTAGAVFGISPAAQASDFNVANKSDGAAPGPAGSLRKAITDANANPGADRIVFDSSVTGNLFLTSGSLPINQALHVDGPGADALTIDAYYSNSRIFTVNPATPGDEVKISGLSLTYGNAGASSGGAIRNEDAKLTVEDSLLFANSAGFTGLGGGAIADAAAYASGAQTTIDSSTIYGNVATAGSSGGIGSASQLGVIVNSTIANNTAETTGGGLLAATGGTIRNSTIAGNHSYDDGGGVAHVGTGAPTVFENSIVGDNTADGTGADLFGSDPFNAAFSLIENTTGVTVTDTVGMSNIAGTDPQLPSFVSSNGGTTPTLLPEFDSPIIDQGMTAGAVTTDQRGMPRPFDNPNITNSTAMGADGADMGAVELTLDETTPADLNLGLADAPDPVTVGNPITYTVTVNNDGPEDATNVEAEQFLPPELSFRAAGSSPSCTAAAQPFGTVVTCLFDSILSGATENRTVVANTLAAAGALGYAYSYAFASADQADPYTYDNSGFAYTVVRPVTPNVPTPGVFVPAPGPRFDLAAAIKKCRKKFHGRRRARCIKRARKKAATSAISSGATPRHPFLTRPRPPGLKVLPRTPNGGRAGD